ncbi:MAG: hypothetical protein AAF430_11690 [Myxococcota bacterium]
MKRFTLLFASLGLLAFAAQGEQHFYVTSVEDKRIDVFRLSDGSAVTDWRTNGDPVDIRFARRAVAGVSRDFLYVAAEDEATIQLPDNQGARVDLKFTPKGILSHAVVPMGQRLFVLQTSNTSGGSVLAELDLQDPTIHTCIVNLTKDCFCSSVALHTLPVQDALYADYSARADRIYVVADNGEVAEFDPNSGNASLVHFGGAPLPSNPGGLTAGPDGTIAISGEDGGQVILTTLDPGNGNKIETVPLPFSEAGGVAFEPRRHRDGYPIWVGDASRSQAVRYRNDQLEAPVSTGGSGANPLDLAVGHRGAVVTANEADSASIVRSGASPIVSTTHPLPTAVTLGPVFEGPGIDTDPYEVFWVYRDLHQPIGNRVVVVQNIGDTDLSVSALSISGFDRANFAIVADACSGNTLPPGDRCTIDLGFRAGAPVGGIRLKTHTYRASLTIASNAPSVSLPLVGEHWTAGISRKISVKFVRPKVSFEFGDGD